MEILLSFITVDTFMTHYSSFHWLSLVQNILSFILLSLTAPRNIEQFVTIVWPSNCIIVCHIKTLTIFDTINCFDGLGIAAFSFIFCANPQRHNLKHVGSKNVIISFSFQIYNLTCHYQPDTNSFLCFQRFCVVLLEISKENKIKVV